MHITDLSRSEDIGANCLLLSIGPFNILVDAGLHPKKMGLPAAPDLDAIDNYKLDAIFLTHCHLDHVGALPMVSKKHPDVPIFSSVASSMLAPRMLRNSHQIMLKQRDEFGVSEYPLYTKADINQLENNFAPIRMRTPKTIHQGSESLTFTLYPAGHIPGAVGIEFQYKHRRIFMTGDVLFNSQMIIPGADFPKGQVDTLITETTRGASETDPEKTRDKEIKRLLETIERTMERGGSCLIPVFALGRMQELMLVLQDAINKKKLKHYPIYCSGLGLDLVEYFDAISRKTGSIQFRKKILHELKIKPLQKKWKPGSPLPQKGIYLVSSGMLVERTPAYNLASTILEDHKSSICFVGYCDLETPGGKLIETPQEKSFLFETLDSVCIKKASVEQFSLSGHANREELLDFIAEKEPRAVVLTHGDPDARAWFTQEIIDQNPKIKIVDPFPGTTYSV